jgi:hypothetical protein
MSAFRPSAGPYLMLSAPLPDRPPAMIVRTMPAQAIARLSAQFGDPWSAPTLDEQSAWQAAAARELAAGELVYVYRRADLKAYCTPTPR